jgi:hypothetical protein
VQIYGFLLYSHPEKRVQIYGFLLYSIIFFFVN